MPRPSGAAGHWVPQFHLREFGAEAMRVPGVPGRIGPRPGHIWQYDKQTGSTSRVSIKRRAAQSPDHYVLPGAPDIESALAGMEWGAAPTIARILDLPDGDHPLSSTDRDILGIYVALLFVRTPANTDLNTALGNASALWIIDMNASQPEKFAADAKRAGMKGSPAELEVQRIEMLDDLRSGRLGVDSSASSKLISLRVGARDLSPMFTSMAWILLRVTDPPWLVLGDQPVVVVDDGGRMVGVLSPGAEVLVSLGPTALLVGRVIPHDGRLRVLDERGSPSLEVPLSAQANAHAWRSARRYVYARSAADLEMARLAMDPARVDRRPRFMVSGLPQEWKQYLSEDLEAVDEPGLPGNLIHWWIE